MKTKSILQMLILGYLAVLTNGASGQSPSSLTNGLVAHYTFNGSYVDLSGNDNTAIPFNLNNLGFVPDAIIGRDVLSITGDGNLNGNGGYIRIPRPMGLGTTATVAINIKEIAYSQWAGMDFINVVGSTALGLVAHNWFREPSIQGLYGMGTRISSELPAFTLTNGGNGVAIDSPQWTSYQIVSENGSSSIYRNAQLVANDLAFFPDSGDLYLNYSVIPQGTLTRLTAEYSDVRVYDRALSAAEVADLAAEVVPEPSTYALLLLSGAASLWALKRRKS